MHPLWGPIEKIDRAQVHLDTLTDEIGDFIKAGRYGGTIGERNPDTGKYALRVITNKADVPPIRWSLLIGEFAFNLHSALDHIACQLALSTSTPTIDIADLFEKTSFPIYLFSARRQTVPRKDRWSDSNKSWLTYMDPAHITLLESFQPYRRRKGQGFWGEEVPSGRRHPLWLLQQLNNADKHRLLQITALATKGMSVIVRWAPASFKIRRIYPKLGSQLIDGAYIGAIDVEGERERVNMQLRVRPDVVFWSGCDAVKGLPVISTLEAIYNHVKYRVLVQLAKQFRPLDPPGGPPE